VGLFPWILAAQNGSSPNILGPYSASTNHAADIMGTPDTRPNTWGDAGAAVQTRIFHPPAGYRVRILRVYGNYQGWIRQKDQIIPGTCTGVLWGLRSNADDTSDMTYGSRNTFAYIQDATCGQPFRQIFDFNVSVGGLLGEDNTMNSVIAIFESDTGQPVHSEASFTVVYRYEKND